jgi:hypothetical protein
MNLKVLSAFIIGALVASGVAFFAARRDRAAEPAAITVSTPQPVQPATPEAVPETPAATPTPAAQPQEKPSAMPRWRRTKKDTPKEVARNQVPPVQTPPVPVTAPGAGPSQPAEAPPASSPAPATPAPILRPEPEPRKPNTVTVAAGTLLNVRLSEALSSEKNQVGDTFSATLDQPVVVDGFVIAERGAKLEGRVVESTQAGRVQGLALLGIELVRLNTADGQRIRIQTDTFKRQPPAERGRDAAKVGAAAGIGAAIGAIAGGGKGAAIGAAVGGAAGTGGVLATRGKPAEVPVETRISFRLSQPVTVTEKLP